MFFNVSLITLAQGVSITGTVVDKDGMSLPGVSVQVKSTTNGTVTDENGKFSVSATKGQVLVFSYVGYKNEEVQVGAETNLNITLLEDAEALDEVVVVGYGVQKKSDVTGSVASLDMENIKDRSVTSVEQMIQGNMTGVSVVSNSGLPGSGVSIRVRGIGTLNSTEPLYVIDGLPFRNSTSEGAGNPMALINPEDIKSIEVLKDASATAIYGSSGANGVVLITTKKGKKGAPKVTFNTSLGISQVRDRIDLLSSKDYIALARDIVEEDPSAVIPAKFSDNKIVGVDRTDWQDEIFRPALQQKYNVSVNGGNDRVLYNFSLGYTNQEGVVLNSDFERYTFRSNVELKLNKWIKVGENFTVAYTKSGRVPEGSNDQNANIFIAGLRMPQYLSVKDKSNLGGYSKATSADDLNDSFNPVALLELTDDDSHKLKIMGNLFAEIQLMKDLKFRTSLGLDIDRSNRSAFTKANKNGNLTYPSQQVDSYGWGNNMTLENVLTYTKSINVHDIMVLAGNSYSKGKGSVAAIQGTNFSNSQVTSIPLAANQSVLTNSTHEYTNAKLGYFGRLNYSFGGKYLFQANFRADGSDRFSPDNRWAYFKAFSGGWKISEESFIKDNVPAIDLLKLRAGYGESGNDLIDQFRYFLKVNSAPVYNFGGKREGGVTVNSIPTPDIKWETTKTTNIGIDLNILNNRLQFTGEYFVKKTSDILIDVPTSASMGLGDKGGVGGSPIKNAADVENKGFELGIKFNDKIGDFKYGVSANLTAIDGEVVSLGENDNSNIRYTYTKTEKGQPIGSFFGHVVDRVYSKQSEVDADNSNAVSKGFQQYQDHAKAGDIRFKDINGDGTITDADRTYIGDPAPDFTYGINLNCEYKGIDFAMNFTGVSGNEIYNRYRYWTEGMTRPFNASTVVLDRWKKEGDVTSVPRAVSGDPARNGRVSDRWIEDGSYLKLKTISLGYTIPKSILTQYTKGQISSCRLYISAQNILTFTDYSGYDPEIGNFVSGSSNMQRGIDYGQYPQPSSVVFGLNIIF